MIHLNDAEIGALIRERKPLPPDYQRRIKMRSKSGHKEASLEMVGENGSTFRILLRQAVANSLDFSVILGYVPPESDSLFRLRRYNGKSHPHTNHIERVSFYDFHVHQATERYQAGITPGVREDSYAEPTTRYADIQGALRCLLDDCGFDALNTQYELPEPEQ